MDRRVFLATAIPFSMLAGCVSESDIIQYARILSVAAGSIGQIIERTQEVLGHRIRVTADAVMDAINRWQYDGGTVGVVINALNALKILLETIPGNVASTVAALIPIALAAIQAIFALLPPTPGPEPPSEPIVWHPGHIPHHFGYAPDKDFRVCWNAAARNVQNAVIFKE